MKVFSGHQPNFIPYMGYFYKMFRSDVFVLDDDVPFSSNNFQNANFMKIDGKKHKITIPVSYSFEDPINEVKIAYQRSWQRKMLRSLEINYRKAQFFIDGYDFIERHINADHETLAELNLALLFEIKERFGFQCEMLVASRCPQFQTEERLWKNERNVFQCKQLGGDVYYSGVGGKEYNDTGLFAENGIEIVYSDYTSLSYQQVNGAFIPDLSVLDYIFNQGFKIPEEWRKVYE